MNRGALIASLVSGVAVFVLIEVGMSQSVAFEVALWRWPWKWLDPVIEKLMPPHSGSHGMGDTHFGRWWLEARLSATVLCTLISIGVYRFTVFVQRR